MERFSIKDLGLVLKYLGVQFEWDRKTHQLWMHQGKYINFLLQEYGLSSYNPVCLPADPKMPFGEPSTSYPEVTNLRSSYLKLIGELIYLSINMPPNIAYVVNSLMQFNTDPSPCHFAAGKRVLQYLAGTLNHHLQYSAEMDNPALHTYADASWANEVGHRSMLGYAWFYTGGLISHDSKKQATVVLSSTEAESMVATYVIQEGLWLKSLFTELSLPFPAPINVYLNNTSTIALSTAAKFCQCTKHIDIRYHFIREHVDNGTFRLIWLPTHKNIADMLIKPLPHPVFSKLSTAIGLVDS